MRKHVNDCGSCYFALISMEMRQRGRCHIGSASRAHTARERGNTRERPICFSEDYGRLVCIKAIKFKRRKKYGIDYSCRLVVDQRPLNNAAAGQESEKWRGKGGSLRVISTSAASTSGFFFHQA